MSCQTKDSKVCNKCKAEKPETAFSKNRTMKDGLQCQCKMCCKLYQRSEEDKVADRRKQAQYRKTKNGKAARKRAKARYGQTERGKAARKRSFVLQLLRYPNHHKARVAVNSAVTAGKLAPAATFQCAYCGNAAQQYHHWHGYDRQHWLDVIPACRKCDKASHKSKETA